MSDLFGLLVIVLIAFPFVLSLGLAIFALVRGRRLSDEVSTLRRRLERLELRQERTPEPVRQHLRADAPERSIERAGEKPAALAPGFPGQEVPQKSAAPAPAPAPARAPAFTAPPPPDPALPADPADRPTLPPPLPGKPSPIQQKASSRPKPINWEAFMGGKLFAWIGGLSLFLGLAFFVRYSFEHDLISPAMRVILGAISGAGLLVGGWFVKRKTYEVTSQTLCATGILTLYACVFASSHAFYGFFSMPVAFVLMVAVTATAFFVSVRLNGQVVAILGLLGGFLTPVLLSTGTDHALALFTYIALLDLGLIAVALRQRWRHLILLAGVATVIMEIGWTIEHFAAAKVFTAMSVFLGFEILFCAVFWWSNRSVAGEKWSQFSGVIVAASAMLFALVFFSYEDLASRPGLVLSYVLLADLCLISMPLISSECRRVLEAAAGLAFLLLTFYTLGHLTEERLYSTLPFYVLFGVIHGAGPILLRKFRPLPAGQEEGWGGLLSQVTPLLTLLLVVLPMMRGVYAFAIWPAALIINVILIAAAVKLRSAILAVGASLVTFLVAAVYVATFPRFASVGLTELLVVAAGFGVFFFVVALVLGDRFGELDLPAGMRGSDGALPGNFLKPEALLAVCSGFLPFMLLVMSVGKLDNVPNPSPLFLVALLLGGMLLFIALKKGLTFLGTVALGGVVLAEASWFNLHFSSVDAIVPLAWFLFFNGLFTMFPFFLRGEAHRAPLAWATSALSGVLHYFLIYGAIDRTWSISLIGLVPALMAVPPLLILFHLIKIFPESDDPHRNSILAWTGGAALFFITLIAPVQFDREWLTVAWALQGAALLWLFHRVPHIGLKITGIALLAVVFVRLTLNPSVFGYHPRSGMPILNWYLWVYGLAAASHFVAGFLLKPPREKLLGLRVQPFAFVGGVVLCFYLLNIEIADFFSSGSRISFDFSANFARDMTYSIAWALFAFPLLLAGFLRKLPACRYAGLALMSVTLLKLFLHDLGQLNQLYRIGALIGVAVIVIAASVLYQRFIPAEPKSHSTSDDG